MSLFFLHENFLDCGQTLCLSSMFLRDCTQNQHVPAFAFCVFPTGDGAELQHSRDAHVPAAPLSRLRRRPPLPPLQGKLEATRRKKAEYQPQATSCELACMHLSTSRGKDHCCLVNSSPPPLLLCVPRVRSMPCDPLNTKRGRPPLAIYRLLYRFYPTSGPSRLSSFPPHHQNPAET